MKELLMRLRISKTLGLNILMGIFFIGCVAALWLMGSRHY